MSEAKERIRAKHREFVRSYKYLLKIFGQAGGNYLSFVIDWHDHLETENIIQDGGDFYCSSTLIENHIGLDKYQQNYILTKLQEMGVISVDYKGFPAKNYYSIDYDKIEELEKADDSQDWTLSTLGSQGWNVPTLGLEKSNPNNNKTNSNKTNTVVEDKPHFEVLSSTTVIGSETEPNQTPMRGFFPIGLIKRRNLSPVEFETPSPPAHRMSSVALEVINKWNSIPGVPHHRLPEINKGMYSSCTKTISDSILIIERVIEGTFFTTVGMTADSRPYTKEEILFALDRYYMIASSSNYYPTNKDFFKVTTLPQFFYNPFSKNPSGFIQCLTEEPKLLLSAVPRQREKNPQMTIWLKEAYVEKVKMGISNNFTQVDENKFIKGANQLYETMRKLQRKLNMMTSPVEWCNIVIDSLISQWGRENVVPGNISSEYTYSETLVRYLKSKGRIG